MSDLRSKIVRLAHARPELRPHLLPLLDGVGARTANTEIRVMDPKDLVKGPSGMHTLRGTSFAPSNVNTPDEAWRWFKGLYAHGVPLRAKSLFQHPDGRYFEYHEIDTSG